MPSTDVRVRVVWGKNSSVERSCQAVAEVVKQYTVIGSPETGDSGGEEQEGGDGDRDAQRQQRGRKLGRGVQRRNGCQERRDGRHEIALARTQRPAGSTNDRHVKRGKTDRREGEIRGSNPCRRSDDREPGAFSRQGFKM